MKAILCECREARILPDEAMADARLRWQEAGYEVYAVADLCAECVAPSAAFRAALADAGAVAACHTRAVRALLAFSGLPVPAPLAFVNLRPHDAGRPDSANPSAPGAPAGVDGWPAWYPVIDGERCTNCGRCLSFCLFGVYAPGERHPRVAQPRHCKNNCPACARICPGVAIIFPKLHESPLNGDAIIDEHAQSQRIRVDTGELLGDDIYEALARRRARAKERLFQKQQRERAEAERAACRAVEGAGL